VTEEKISTPASHWLRRKRSPPIPRDDAVRQGNITRLAFILLGRDAAIAFLNGERPDLGGRPLAIATASEGGEARVRAMLQELTSGPVRMNEAVFR
jgi:hypothetical protein